MKPIPYGLSGYKQIREDDCYYIDKTRYIPQLEATGKFLFFIRPRRFGKSSWLTVLESYYDISRSEQFDFFFKGTDIYDQPTSEKNAHLILKFNFSAVNPQPDMVEDSFQGYTDNCFYFFGMKYRAWLDDDYFTMMERQKTPHQKLRFLLNYVGLKGHQVYVLIDEYDNFANTILTTAGQTAYQNLTHGAGFFRFFFNVLKEAVDQVDSGISRMFITGVSPVTMDDVTSGFNIGKNISLHPNFNELLGFAEPDVIELLRYYQEHSNLVVDDFDKTLNVMKAWYDNYRFSSRVETKLFNTDMALYFVDNLLELGTYPDDMIDQNVKIDYGKLRYLVVLDKRLNGNFSHIAEIVKTQGTQATRVVPSFPVEDLIKSENFISLLFYFGLLSYSETNRLTIPNQTIKQLMYSYLRRGYQDVDVFNVDIWRLSNLVQDMAYQGEWRPVFEFLADEVEKQTSIRDYLTGEKVIQTFLLAYLSVTDYFIIRTEEELGKGFVDLYMEPFLAKYDHLQYSYLIELKYLTRTEFTEEKLKEKLNKAKTQLNQYATDTRIIKRSGGGQIIKVALAFSGWELKAIQQY
ncbi:AAA family ATPase [Anaerolineales bacterium HSG25]|nr:AAA family ATPase [Anaerolineales bacterium HSG25]